MKRRLYAPKYQPFDFCLQCLDYSVSMLLSCLKLILSTVEPKRLTIIGGVFVGLCFYFSPAIGAALTKDDDSGISCPSNTLYAPFFGICAAIKDLRNSYTGNNAFSAAQGIPPDLATLRKEKSLRRTDECVRG